MGKQRTTYHRRYPFWVTIVIIVSVAALAIGPALLSVLAGD